MPEQQVQLQEKTSTHISTLIVIGLIATFGLAAAAGFWLIGKKTKQQTTNNTSAVTAITSTTSTNLSNQKIPPKEDLVTFSATQTTNTNTTINTNTGNSISLAITSPTEGAIVDGGTAVTVSLNDPNHQVSGVKLSIYSDLWPDYFGGVATIGVVTQSPYTFFPDYRLYPSGEVRYVAEAIAPNGYVLASTDTMATWARTCYYLAYQDMTLNVPTASVAAGKSLTLTGSLTNHMRGDCQNIYEFTTLDLSGRSLLPDGWTATLSPTSLNMGIGETKQYTVTVQVPPNTPAGTYSVGVTSHRQFTGFIVTKTVDVTVTKPSSGGGLTNRPVTE